MNKKTVALTEKQYREIISTIRNGFMCSDGHIVKPNNRIATALSLEANLGLRISDILQLRLSVIVRDGDRYRLDIVEQKTKKKREFTVPTDIYIYIQNYALENNINPAAKLFDMSERAVTKHLKLVCDYLGYSGIGSHSFRKYFATSIYVNNHCSRSFYVGEDVKQEDIKARFEDGTLRLQVPKNNKEVVVENPNYITIEG